jgi:hypothetical protein
VACANDRAYVGKGRDYLRNADGLVVSSSTQISRWNLTGWSIVSVNSPSINLVIFLGYMAVSTPFMPRFSDHFEISEQFDPQGLGHLEILEWFDAEVFRSL